MSRNVAAAIITAMAAGTFEPLFLFEAEFDSGPLYLWNGIGNLTIDSKTYTGAGSLLSISEAQETSAVIARGMNIALTGIPSSLISLALAEPYQGRSCLVRIGFKNSSDTTLLFSGLLDQMNIDESDSTSVISVFVENELALLDRIVKWLYTDASQKSRYPSDDFFSHVTALGDQELQWGG